MVPFQTVNQTNTGEPKAILAGNAAQNQAVLTLPRVAVISVNDTFALHQCNRLLRTGGAMRGLRISWLMVGIPTLLPKRPLSLRANGRDSAVTINERASRHPAR